MYGLKKMETKLLHIECEYSDFLLLDNFCVFRILGWQCSESHHRRRAIHRNLPWEVRCWRAACLLAQQLQPSADRGQAGAEIPAGVPALPRTPEHWPLLSGDYVLGAAQRVSAHGQLAAVGLRRQQRRGLQGVAGAQRERLPLFGRGRAPRPPHDRCFPHRGPHCAWGSHCHAEECRQWEWDELGGGSSREVIFSSVWFWSTVLKFVLLSEMRGARPICCDSSKMKRTKKVCWLTKKRRELRGSSSRRWTRNRKEFVKRNRSASGKKRWFLHFWKWRLPTYNWFCIAGNCTSENRACWQNPCRACHGPGQCSAFGDQTALGWSPRTALPSWTHASGGRISNPHRQGNNGVFCS